jgi:hypothetical protein
MSKRYREAVEVVGSDEGPVGFSWRGSHYKVISVLGHWREDAGYWAGGGIEVPQRDLWRVEARNGTPSRVPSSSVSDRACGGVYELVSEAGAWRLDRVWD